jgi:hypothetical protein
MLRTSSVVRTDATMPTESVIFRACRSTSSVSIYHSTFFTHRASNKVPKRAWLSLALVFHRFSFELAPTLEPGSPSSSDCRFLPNPLPSLEVSTQCTHAGQGRVQGHGAENVEKQKLRTASRDQLAHP